MRCEHARNRAMRDGVRDSWSFRDGTEAKVLHGSVSAAFLLAIGRSQFLPHRAAWEPLWRRLRQRPFVLDENRDLQPRPVRLGLAAPSRRSEEHTSELQ